MKFQRRKKISRGNEWKRMEQTFSQRTSPSVRCERFYVPARTEEHRRDRSRRAPESNIRRRPRFHSEPRVHPGARSYLQQISSDRFGEHVDEVPAIAAEQETA